MSDPSPIPEPAKKPPRPIWMQVAYNAMPLLFVLVLGAVGLPLLFDTLAPPPRQLMLAPEQERRAAQPPASPAPGPATSLAPNTASESGGAALSAAGRALEESFGAGTVQNVRRAAQRMAGAAHNAVRCNLRDGRWATDLREALGADAARRYVSLDGKEEDSRQLGQFAMDLFRAGAEPPALSCADVAVGTDFRGADSLVQDFRTARGSAGPGRP